MLRLESALIEANPEPYDDGPAVWGDADMGSDMYALASKGDHSDIPYSSVVGSNMRGGRTGGRARLLPFPLPEKAEEAPTFSLFVSMFMGWVSSESSLDWVGEESTKEGLAQVWIPARIWLEPPEEEDEPRSGITSV